MEERLEYNYRGLGVLTLCVLLFAVGIWRFGGGTAPVSSTFGGKAQPVCSVITDKKQVSLTFDTVGGNGEYFSKISDKSDIFHYRGVGKEIPGRCEADSCRRA